MAFGATMRMKVGELTIELAAIPKSLAGEFVAGDGGMQLHSVHRYLSHRTAPTVQDEEEWYDKVRQNKDELAWGIWVVDGDKRTLIGNTALFNIEGTHFRQATSGSLIFRQEYWGKGIASAIHKARTWYAFNQLGLTRIKSAVVDGNHGSRKALERTGYSLVYVERNELFVDGTHRHMNCLECLNPRPESWNRWWHGEHPPKLAREARQRTLTALSWADEHVTLL